MALHFYRSSTLNAHIKHAVHCPARHMIKKKTTLFDFRDSVSTRLCVLPIIQAFTMAARQPSPQDKQETADTEAVSDAHMMLIDRWLPRVAHADSGSVLIHNAGPAGHRCTATEVTV